MYINSIFLSGWEFNKFLSNNPFSSSQSGLPADILWNGCSQFLFFENMYCTKESLDGEESAYDALDWSTGWIFKDLKERGFLTPINWKEIEQNNSSLTNKINIIHKEIKVNLSIEKIKSLISSGETTILEGITQSILKPILSEKNCVQNISPSSVSKWFQKDKNLYSIKNENATNFEIELINYIQNSKMKLLGGFKLCDLPGTGCTKEELITQKNAEKYTQKELIPSLLTGELSQEEYYRILEKDLNAYKPINNQLKNNYKRNIGKLEKIREISVKHLWPKLHNEWLPRLEEEGTIYLPEFKKEIKHALNYHKFQHLFDIFTNISLASIPFSTGPIVGLPVSLSLKKAVDIKKESIKPILSFLQAVDKGY